MTADEERARDAGSSPVQAFSEEDRTHLAKRIAMKLAVKTGAVFDQETMETVADAALAVLAPKLALRDQLLREAMEQIEVRENTIERLEAQLAAFAPVVAELEEYRGARQYDACMDGPKFKGWNRSQLDRARCMTEAAERAAGGAK